MVVVDVVVVVVPGEEAAVTVDACTRVRGEFSFVLAAGAVGKVDEVTESACGSAAGAGVDELICASERVRTPSNAAVPQRKCLKRLDISMEVEECGSV